jgi:rhamnose transport system permease protein
MKTLSWFSRWEVMLVILTLVAMGISAQISPYYLSIDQMTYSSRQFIIPGFLALGLMIVVTTGEIDISLASTLAVGAVLFAKCSALQVPVGIAFPLVIIACAALGAINGILVAVFHLPSLAVTLGTMGAYRGLAFIIGGERGYTEFTDPYLFIGSEQIFSFIPISLVFFAAAVFMTALFMHGTVFGRRCFSIGNNKEASWYSGVSVVAIKIQSYAVAGFAAGLASLIWIGQYGSARGDNADGTILFVVTAVVLGGVDINGGRGTVAGVALALLLLGTIRNGMGLANIPGPTQTVVLGFLLIVGVLRPVIARLFRPFLNRFRPPSSPVSDPKPLKTKIL